MATILLLAGAAATQSDPDTISGSSRVYFLLNFDTASGGTTSSTTYALHGSGGSGVVASRASSPTYRLESGALGTLDMATAGRPWLAGVEPRFVTLRGRQNLTLRGTSFGTPAVRVDGRTASVIGAPSRDRVTVRLPLLGQPGWRPVSLADSNGTTTLPRGVGVLPMVFADPTPRSDLPFSLVFKGSPGDQVVWAVGFGTTPTITLPGIHHGPQINPSLFLVLPGFRILGANGEQRLPLPAATYAVTLYAQALFTTSNAGYGPASFSNLLVIRP